jgi:hypothetical protein
MVRLSGVEQEQRMAGWRGVEDDESVLPGGNSLCEGPEHRDLLGARRSKIFFQDGTPLCVETTSGIGKNRFLIPLRLQDRIDAANRHARHAASDCIGNVSSRVGRGQMNAVPTPSQFDGDGRCDCSLAYPSLPHCENDPASSLLDFLDEGQHRQMICLVALCLISPFNHFRALASVDLSERVHSERSKREKRDLNSQQR